jgi:hypothetical protein
MKLLLENWKKFLNEGSLREARTGMLISILERGLHSAIKSLGAQFTNMSDYGPLNLGVVSFKLASESMLKKDVKLQVYGFVFDDFRKAGSIIDQQSGSPRPDEGSWVSIIKKSELLQEIPLGAKQIQHLDNQGILNGMSFVSVAFALNDLLSDLGNRAAVERTSVSTGNQFKDKNATSVEDFFAQQLGGEMVRSFAIISATYLPSSPDKFRKAFLNFLSVLTHEVEHTFQKETGYNARTSWSETFEGQVKYLTDPGEAEAHVAQFYMLQRRRQGAWIELVNGFLSNRFKLVAQKAVEQGMPEQEANQKNQEAINTVLNTWIKIAKYRFPEAQIES